MSIARDFLDGNGTLPILFHVSERYEVWDGQAALIIDHLLNHIKVLNSLAEGPADQTVITALAKYPHYNIGNKSYLSETTRDRVSKQLIQECTLLLNCLAQIAPIMAIEQKQRNDLLEVVREQVPFIDYHYIDQPSLSDAKRED
ncbi:MAG: hypothetical protein AAF485_13525 [Chloroflexota bacterium]